MLRTAASRALPRRAWRLPAPRPRLPPPSPRASFPRHLSTAPPHQLSRGWKNSAARWGIALVGIYWYNTTNVFAEEPPAHLAQRLSDSDTSQLPTLDSLSPSARRRRQLEEAQDAAAASEPSTVSTTQIASDESAAPTPGDGIEGLEEEAHSEGAFNPETGEINWDCPCLGGMAHGPCGPEFREAFSCFVFSSEEPKGMDCIDRFKNMQNCFREHPDVYGAELEGDEDDDDDDMAVAGVGHEDAGVAAAPPEDAPHVAVLAEKIKEKDRVDTSDAPVKSSSRSGSSGSGEAAEVSAKNAASDANEAKARETDDSAAPALSRTPKQPPVEKRRPDNESAEEAIVPRAAHDARDAPVPKKDD